MKYIEKEMSRTEAIETLKTYATQEWGIENVTLVKGNKKMIWNRETEEVYWEATNGRSICDYCGRWKDPKDPDWCPCEEERRIMSSEKLRKYIETKFRGGKVLVTKVVY